MTIEHLHTLTDPGRLVNVESSNAIEGGLYLFVGGEAGHLSRSDAVKLAKSLAVAYLDWPAEPETPETPDYPVGTPLVVTDDLYDLYDLKIGQPVVVVGELDEDGDYRVAYGPADDEWEYVHASSLAPFIELDAPTPAPF